jgi:hypothetical protein
MNPIMAGNAIPANNRLSRRFSRPGPIGTPGQQDTTSENHARMLTAGEIAMSRLIFKDSIDYSTVKIHNHEYLWFGLQPDDTAMTPNGEMYFNKSYYRDDFSKLDATSQRWFIHEMVRVWQYQLGYPVKLRGAIRIGLSYKYTLGKGQKLSDYNMEAQGDILADYYVLKFLKDPAAMTQRQFADSLDLYEQEALIDFLADPTNRSSLPGGQQEK